MSIETVSEVKSHGGIQGVYRHASSSTGTDMTFSVFMPPQPEKGEPLPVLWYLSGLTCTHANVTEELPALVADHFPIDTARQGITGHSMGGHGALTVALRHTGRFRSVSAFAPIVAPSQVPWGENALSKYLGPDRSAWLAHDAVSLIEFGARLPDLLVDVGNADPFLERELKPELLAQACADAGIPLTLRIQPGYDHSYYFISSFMADHVRWHAERLTA